MPEHNLIQRPDLISRLQSFFGIRQAHVTPTLGTTISPVVLVADLTKEQLGTRHVPGLPTTPLLVAAHVVQAAVAAQFGRVLLFNPPGSNRIIRVLAYNSTVNVELWTAYNVTSPLANFGIATCLDGDQKSNALAPVFPVVGNVSSDTNAGPVPVPGFQKLGPGIGSLTPLDNPPMILDEGDGFLIWNVTVNSATDINLRWLEETKSQG